MYWMGCSIRSGMRTLSANIAVDELPTYVRSLQEKQKSLEKELKQLKMRLATGGGGAAASGDTRHVKVGGHHARFANQRTGDEFTAGRDDRRGCGERGARDRDADAGSHRRAHDRACPHVHPRAHHRWGPQSAGVAQAPPVSHAGRAASACHGAAVPLAARFLRQLVGPRRRAGRGTRSCAGSGAHSPADRHCREPIHLRPLPCRR